MKTDFKIALYLLLKALLVGLYLVYIGILVPLINNEAISIPVILIGAIVTLLLLGAISNKMDKIIKEEENDD